MPLFLVLVFTSLYGVSMTGGRRGRIFFLAGLLLNAAYLVYRWQVLGRPPLSERHDILLLISLGVALSYLPLSKKESLDRLLMVLPLFTVFFCFAAIFEERIDTIEPNMNSPWFFLHVMLLSGGYILLTVGALAGVLVLWNGPAALEPTQYRVTLLGWLLFSLALIAGSVWFYLVHGVYWLWTAKELWTTISWFYYSFYLHARMVRGLKGRPAVLIGTAGFAILMFSYLGVVPVLGSPWTQF